MTPADLMLKFESFGDNCEFGLVQRKAGAEPLGLFRFAFIPPLPLLKGLATDFAGIDDPDTLEVYIGKNREINVRQHAYAMVYHTGLLEGAGDLADIKADQIRRLGFLRRQTIATLEKGEKLIVRKGPPDRERIDPLHKALRARGPNWLLWVLPDPNIEAGCAEILEDGLMQGRVDRFAPDGNAYQFSYQSWLQLCVAAEALWPRAGAGNDPA